MNYEALNFHDDRLSQLIKFLHKNRAIRFVNGKNKLMQPIPYDFRIDRSCYGENMVAIGEMLADRFIEIENELNVEFDSMLCSLFSGVFSGVSTAMWLKQKYNRNIKLAISRRSYEQKMGAETGTESFISSVHQMKNKTLVGELGKNVLIHDEMTNTGFTIQELINISKFNGVEPKAVMIIADRILEPLPSGSNVRMYGDIPCYCSLTHFDLITWCEENQEIWNSLYEQMYDNQNKFTDSELKSFETDLYKQSKEIS